MAQRPIDYVELRGGPGTLSVFESVEIMSSIIQPTEAKFVIGDDTAWPSFQKDTQPGAEYEQRKHERKALGWDLHGAVPGMTDFQSVGQVGRIANPSYCALPSVARCTTGRNSAAKKNEPVMQIRSSGLARPEATRHASLGVAAA